LDEIRSKQKEELANLQSEIDQKKKELEFCKSRYELDYQNLENVHKKSENEIVRLTQDITEKERSIEDLQTRLVESQSSYNIQIEELKARQAEELEQFKQKAIDELRSDGILFVQKGDRGVRRIT
jgi:predicted RNase H-like nuclease (RuvC/YqgF family)